MTTITAMSKAIAMMTMMTCYCMLFLSTSVHSFVVIPNSHTTMLESRTKSKFDHRLYMLSTQNDTITFTNTGYDNFLDAIPTPSSLLDAERMKQMFLSEEGRGFIALMIVPIIWGTYMPIVRFVYGLELPMPGLLFSACYFTAAFVAGTAMATFSEMKTTSSSSTTTTNNNNNNNNNNNKDMMTLTIGESNNFENNNKNKWLSPSVIGGVELGLYVTLANFLNVIGLETVPSDRSGFLMQMTTVMVPFVQAFKERNMKSIDGITWLGCLIALMGILLMNIGPVMMMESSDGSEPLSALAILSSSFSGGGGLILCAAFLYSLQVVRVGDYSNKTNPLRLSANKAGVEAVCSWVVVMALAAFASNPESNVDPDNGLASFCFKNGNSFLLYFSDLTSGLNDGTLSSNYVRELVGATVWAGAICTVALVAIQSYAQRLVNPTDANLVYSLQPVCTAGFAYLLLNERMDPMGMVGGSIILSAIFLVASKNLGEEKETG